MEEDIIERARGVVQLEAAAVAQFAEQLDATIAPVLEMLATCKGHVLVSGAGTSHAMAQRFAHLLSCTGTPAICIDAGDALHGASGAITGNDILYLISKGGRSVEVNNLAVIARKRGARIITQTEDPHSPLAEISDAVYTVRVDPAVDPYGMIATGSSLVTGAAGDVLCVLLLGLRGYTREDFGQTHPAGAVGLQFAGKEGQ